MDKNRKLDYVFFTIREFTTKVFNTVVDDLTDMLMKNRPDDKRICIIHFDQEDGEKTVDGLGTVINQVQLEYSTIKSDTNTSSVQLCAMVGMLESTVKEDMFHITIDIPSNHTHLEYDFWIGKDENDTMDDATNFCFRGSSRGRLMSSDADGYQGYKYYKEFFHDSIAKVFAHAHVAVRTDPNDPDYFVFR